MDEQSKEGPRKGKGGKRNHVWLGDEGGFASLCLGLAFENWDRITLEKSQALYRIHCATFAVAHRLGRATRPRTA